MKAELWSGKWSAEGPGQNWLLLGLPEGASRQEIKGRGLRGSSLGGLWWLQASGVDEKMEQRGYRTETSGLLGLPGDPVRKILRLGDLTWLLWQQISRDVGSSCSKKYS